MKRILAVASAGLIIWLLGCGDGNGAPPQDTTPPTISNVQVNPTTLPRFTGGEVTISAQVSDSSGVAEVWAEVQNPDETKKRVIMNPIGDVYQGKVTVGANLKDQVETYKVWVRAKDEKGNTTPEPGEPAEGVSFVVPALEPPPKPPF